MFSTFGVTPLTYHCGAPQCPRHPFVPGEQRSTAPNAVARALESVPRGVSARVEFSALVRLIRQELGVHGLGSKNVDVNRIQVLMGAYVSRKDDWAQYALFDPYKYTRNLVDDGNGEFNLLILAWGPGQKSAIHDHADSHCVMKVLDGDLIETQYHWPTQAGSGSDASNDQSHSSQLLASQQALSIKQETRLRPDAVTYIHDKIGLHRVANPSTTKGAVSLHLYSPPIRACQTFDERTGHARASGTQTFFSQYGVKTMQTSK
ncbi:hypothetical protein H4R35_003613 [Dimargaris xerosporica]|nr:hypothetical protein H4R35_003613 [Dimargaris xerosporica]